MSFHELACFLVLWLGWVGATSSSMKTTTAASASSASHFSVPAPLLVSQPSVRNEAPSGAAIHDQQDVNGGAIEALIILQIVPVIPQ